MLHSLPKIEEPILLSLISFHSSYKQILSQKKAPRGRRYSREDKIFAMSLLKHSGKSYKFLKTIFALLSRKTLMSMLSKIPFGCGIQQPIFDSIKNLKPRDRHCVLMFDEISLQPSLHYITNKKRIDGFEDLCSDQRVARIADHAMVFMIKGLSKSWKQPGAFFSRKMV